MQQKLSLEDALDLFLLDAQAQHFTGHTLRFYRQRLSSFVSWCESQGVLTLSAVAASHIRQYLVYLQSRNLSSAYIHGHARAIKTFCNFCVRDELLRTSPFDKVKMPKLEQKVLSALSDDEAKKVIAAGKSERDKALMLFLLDSGARGSELSALNVGDVGFKTGAVTIHQGKGQKDRTTHIGANTPKQLKRYLIERSHPQVHEPLFTSKKGGDRLTYSGVAQLFKQLRKLSGVKHLTAHTMRRTFALNCVKAGIDLFRLAKIIGHADISVLRVYLDTVKLDTAGAHKRASPTDNLL
jgi:integrase/recombinase XerD